MNVEITKDPTKFDSFFDTNDKLNDAKNDAKPIKSTVHATKKKNEISNRELPSINKEDETHKNNKVRKKKKLRSRALVVQKLFSF